MANHVWSGQRSQSDFTMKVPSQLQPFNRRLVLQNASRCPRWGQRSSASCLRWSAEREDLWPGEALFKNIPSWVKGVEDHASIFHLPLSSTTCTLLQDFTKTQMWSSEGWLHTLTSSFCFLGKISTDTNVHKGGSYRIIMFLMRRCSFPEVCSVIGFTVNNFW